MDEYVKSVTISFDAKDSIIKIGKQIKDTVAGKLQDAMKDIGLQFKDVFNSIVSNFKISMKDVIDEMKSMLEYSQLSSSKTRELAFGYGFSSSQAYGWEKALKAVGLNSEEDLYYANEQEMAQFREAFTKYSNQYSQLYDSGFFKTMQDYQFEMADFKNEMQLEVVKFFMDNKELIKTGMKGIMEISKVILQIFGWLVGVFGRGTQSDLASTSDIVNQYTQTSNSKNTNVSVSNTFNNVAKEDETWLANAGSMTYEQVIQALGGKQ